MHPVTYLDNTYRIIFNYPRKHSQRRRRVKCFITSRTHEILSQGESSCNLKEGDTFDKELGRKLALESAITAGEEIFPRPLRRLLWESYWQRSQTHNTQGNGGNGK